jgi:hypothetical protein
MLFCLSMAASRQFLAGSIGLSAGSSVSRTCPGGHRGEAVRQPRAKDGHWGWQASDDQAVADHPGKLMNAIGQEVIYRIASVAP